MVSHPRVRAGYPRSGNSVSLVSFFLNLSDIFLRLYPADSSDGPDSVLQDSTTTEVNTLVTPEVSTPKATRTCSACGQVGHISEFVFTVLATILTSSLESNSRCPKYTPRDKENKPSGRSEAASSSSAVAVEAGVRELVPGMYFITKCPPCSNLLRSGIPIAPSTPPPQDRLSSHRLSPSDLPPSPHSPTPLPQAQLNS